jgi:hypothetical protein
VSYTGVQKRLVGDYPAFFSDISPGTGESNNKFFTHGSEFLADFRNTLFLRKKPDLLYLQSDLVAA